MSETKYLETHEFVIGSRYVEGGSCLMSGKRLVMSKFGNKLIRKILQINSNEFTTSYRGFNLKMLEDFHLKNVDSKGYSFFMESIYLINSKKVLIKQIPIHFKNRQKGKSKIPKIEMFRTLYTTNNSPLFMAFYSSQKGHFGVQNVSKFARKFKSDNSHT